METSELLRLLRFEKIEHTENFNLAPASSFKVGGTAKIAVFPRTEHELSLALAACARSEEKTEIIGKGSNVVFPERFDGAVIFMENLCALTVSENYVLAGAGVSLCAAAVFARDAGLSGLEFAFGIPGSVGGAVFMNAGAYDGEMSNVLISSRALDRTDERIFEMSAAQHNFSYRKSIYQEKRNLVCLDAKIKLYPKSKQQITEKMNEFMSARRAKQPLEYPSAGSFFKRPAGYFAAKLIDDCGLRGFSVGGAAVSDKHSGFVINKGGATAKDLRELGEYIENAVFLRFGVRLEREVRFIE